MGDGCSTHSAIRLVSANVSVLRERLVETFQIWDMHSQQMYSEKAYYALFFGAWVDLIVQVEAKLWNVTYREHRLVCWLLMFCTIATVFQLYHGADMCMRWEGESPRLHFCRLKGSLHTPLPTPYRNGIRGGTDLWWCCKLYTARKYIVAQLNVITVTGIRTPVPRVTYPAL